MARPFPTTFEKDSRINPPSGGSTPISYQANVNRQKTKKWTDAKPVDYGGDDWGDDDEYEYDEPPPVPKPTGLRQQGHTLQNVSQSNSPVADNDKKKYGNLPSLPTSGTARPRNNSFDAGDEKRNFSSSATPTSPQNPTAGPATRFSQITGVPSTRNASGPPLLSISTQPESQSQPGVHQSSEVVSPIPEQPYKDTAPSGGADSMGNTSMTSPVSDTRTPLSDYQARRDYSPTALPAPLSTRSPVAQNTSDSPATRFPARKSSLSQAAPPNIAEITDPPQETTTQKLWIGGREPSPAPRTESPSAPAAKPLPFIRPADIYRRAEEERRQSLESGGRPSMDAMMGSRPGERSESPGKPSLKEETSSDSLGGRRRVSAESDDLHGSNRHLLPMLEPVKERKSEYGFEGFDVKDHGPKDDALSPTVSGQTLSDSARLDVEDVRRQSTSPKLPDLNRMSGFGMDMFTNPDASQAPPIHPRAVDEMMTQQPLSADTDESQLPRQPSIGLRSVVNQAFDRVDDSSVPMTPASGNSNVKRADSDSTGGISPIMRHGPGDNQPESSLNEIVEEQAGPASTSIPHRGGSTDTAADAIPGFKHGYRRDLSAPSSDNSLARTPDVAKAEYFPLGQQAVVTDRSIDSNEEEPVPSRPVAHTDDSFRPTLPGGWTSYEASTRTETPQPEGTRTAASLDHARSDEDHNDIAPTTTKYPLPQSVFGATGGAAFSSDSARGRHDEDTPLALPVLSNPKPTYDNDSLPTPDSTMAPSGNLYSAASVDPRLLPKLEQAPPETRPGISNRNVSSDSTDVPPPPLPKDTPVLHSTAESEGVFPSADGLRKTSIDSYEDDGEPDSQVKQHNNLAAFRDGNAEEDDNDELEKEIVRRLSPQPLEGNAMENSLLPNQPNDATRESTYLPKEYGDYWASTSEGAPAHTSSDQQVDREILSHAAESPIGEISPPTHAESEGTPITSLSVQQSEQPLEGVPRQPLTQRFSWEQSTENVPDLAGQEREFSDEKQLREGPVPTTAEHGPAASPATSPKYADLHDDEKIPLSQENPSTTRRSSEEHHTGRDAALIGGAAALTAGGVAAVTMGSPKDQPGRRLSLADEKATRVSSNPVSITPPEDEHPARSPQPYFPSTTEQLPPPSTVSPVTSPAALQTPQNTGRLLAFKEIAAMKSPYQRIQTFDETRHRFAAMDSGLTDWIATLRAQHPEHANVTGSWTKSGPGAAATASSRSRLGKPAGPSQPLQQPYYQQYLNASSPTSPSTPVNKPSPSAPAAYQQQGFSPAGPSKMTSQQVQAKGKEFLHTAGVFGGKAGKAGKGLLAKGKNKLRGGGGDKTSPVPPQSKNDRRSSWGLPLALSKSAGGSESPVHVISKQRTSVLVPNIDHRRSAATSVQSVPPQLPPAISAEASGSLEYTPSPNTQTPHVPSPSPSPLPPTLPHIRTQSGSQDEFTTTVREIKDADQSTTESESHDEHGHEDRDRVEDKLRVPAPIGKHQPSWDPFNATPIAEEQGSAYENNPNERSYPFPSTTADRQAKISISSDAAGKSDCSNSVDAHFHDAVEEQTDIKNDWVMVDSRSEEADVTTPPEANIAEAVNIHPPSMMHRPRGSSYTTPVLPISNAATKLSEQPVAVPTNVSAPRGLDAFVAGPEYQRDNYKQLDATRNESQNTVDSSFLPPIRRTSTFGFKLGSRQAKPRFPIEDDDSETAIPQVPNATLSIPPAENENSSTTVASNEPRTVSRRDSQSEGPRSLRQQFAGHINQESTETLRQERDIQSEDRPRRPSLIQASSSEYSQISSDQPTDRTYQVPVFDTIRPGMGQAQTSRSRQSSVERHVNIQQLPHEQKFPSHGSPPSLEQADYSGYSQNNITADRGSEVNTDPSRPSDLPKADSFRTSQQSWRPNAITPSQPSPPKQQAPISYAPRRSWEAQRPRGSSGSSQGFMPRPGEPYNDRSQWIPQHSRAFEQPPSSAQRYPDLFRSESPSMDAYEKETGGGGDLPPQYYQPPLPREAAFLPRQQTNEYQLPGVGPPSDEPPRGSPRRNSSFFKEIGGRLSRATSRERGKSISRIDDLDSPKRRSESPGNEYADSAVNPEDTTDQRKRRSSFFRVVSRSSTGALNPPSSQESMVANYPGSRTDLLMTPRPSPLATQEKKRSFFGSTSSSGPSPKPKKLLRASTSGMADISAGKKKRFSGLSGLFGKSSPTQSFASDRPQATRELSYDERQPLEPPHIESQHASRNQPSQWQGDRNSPQPHNPLAPLQARYSNTPPQVQSIRPPQQVQSKRSSSQESSAALSKLMTNMDSSQSAPPEIRPRKVSKARRSSGAGLLGGIMGRRRSSQPDEKSDDSRSQGSSSQPHAPQFVPPAQTYTDLQKQEPQNATGAPRRENVEQDPSAVPQDRGRQTEREPQYDNVPIPGGYSLVRGQGAQVVYSDYDPRGLRSQQIDPRFVQRTFQSPASEWERPQRQESILRQDLPQQQPYRQQSPWAVQPTQHTAPKPQNQKVKHTPPNLAALDTYQAFHSRHGSRLSVEDQLARSPARSPEGQQRPYQLSLPEDNEDREYPVRGSRSSMSPTSPITHSQLSVATTQPKTQVQHETIQRLSRTAPQIRHPESPAGYPLPDDVVFSPINPSADDLPPPPPPKDAPQQGFTQILSRNSYLGSTDLNRSSTHRTAVSALSGVSDPTQHASHGSDFSNNNFRRESSGQSVPIEQRTIGDGDRHVSSPSPTPPSPAGTPDPNSHHGIRTTVVEADRRSSLDIYDASPMNAPLPAPASNGHAQQSDNDRRLAELEGTKADGFQMKIGRDRGQEEKIFYDAESGMRGGPSQRGDDNYQGNIAMSATSYPGQEWNPYGMGGYDDDDVR